MGIQARIETWFANREEIEEEIERLIGLLDFHDDDVDLEDGHDAEAVNEDGGEDVAPLLPVYGVDQSRGAINQREGYIAWQVDQLRLERSPSDGWRQR